MKQKNVNCGGLMKTLWMVAAWLSAVAVQAQQISSAGYWYDGSMNYTAEPQAGGKVLMNGMTEGEEHEFMLVPVAGKSDTYRVTDGVNDYTNNYAGMTARHVKQDGWDLICLYNAKNQLEAVMSNETLDYEVLNRTKWMQQIMGDYTLPDGSKVSIQWENMVVRGATVPYTVVMFNGMVTGYIEVEGSGAQMGGTWEVVPTLEGLHLFAIEKKGDYLYEWERTHRGTVLTESNPNQGRFAYASTMLLNDKSFRRLKKSTLRIMRNAIMARHGYRFQSQDLQNYFAKEPWYKPAASNDQIRLSLIERLNVELIKCEEENPEHDQYVAEE